METSSQRAPHNGFDKLAAPYRWMEYLTFGPLLWRTRCAFLPVMNGASRAVVLGDGDGRFSAALLRSVPDLHLHAVDGSGAMLQRLTARVERQGDRARLQTLRADATATLPDGAFDLVCTHFFLDCLTTEQCRALACNVAARMDERGMWVISEFAVPEGPLNLPARFLLRALYAAFGILTGLRVQTLPDYADALCGAGLRCAEVRTRVGGILRSELWLADRCSGPESPVEHPMRHE